MAQTDIRVMVPRVRRAVEGVGGAATLTDDQVKDLVADAVADVILYSGSAFGQQLVVTDTEGAPPYPSEYATSDELTLPEQGVIASQAALNHFFFAFAGVKTSEKIVQEGRSFEWTSSAQLLRDRLAMLIAQRDRALEALAGGARLDAYVSFVAVRDGLTSALIEPWVDGHTGIASGQEIDFRFGTIG